MTEKTFSNVELQAPESITDTELCEIKEREGGCAAWLTVVGSILVYYASFGIMNSFGFFQNYYTSEFLRNTPTSTIAFIGTLQMALMNSLAAISGALCDRYGVKYLYLGSGTGTIVALLLLSFVRPGQFWQIFLIQGLLMGLTIAFGVQPAQTVVGQHFKERRALAMGLVSTGSALGGIGFPLMFERLLPIVGFSNALRLTALKIGICYSIALCISTSLPSGKSGKSGRSSCSSLIDLRGFLDLRYAVLCVGTWFAILGLWIPSYYIKIYANVAYPGNTISEYFLCIMYGCSIFGAIFGGLLGDKVGRLNLLWPMALVSGCLCLFLWLLSNSLATLVLFACVYGFSTSSVSALPASIIGQITPDDILGARIGAFYSIVAIASLVGTPIGGALITDADQKEGYRWLILFSGVSLMVGSIFMLGSRLLHDKDLRKKW
ncbi:MFS general substrate transporter [Cucurbitaria berberidis CBS 394.84]|uniref:MFS general substrate transporter n=1 Tax=Cucurbitaria berberidis CBS 394.84 TaxID=1168544 RepID=A0A9P4GAL1_9PLEO|nr:MFS general substrate transporter [Cucurbitaria berberidis CBS 394.84]KAF1842253.1 MFS general substrate transporter [Cucurbitaria berberidis CBS 394.84]